MAETNRSSSDNTLSICERCGQSIRSSLAHKDVMMCIEFLKRRNVVLGRVNEALQRFNASLEYETRKKTAEYDIALDRSAHKITELRETIRKNTAEHSMALERFEDRVNRQWKTIQKLRAAVGGAWKPESPERS